MFIPSLVVFSLCLVTSSASEQVQDFCVANLSQIDTPSGFACKDVTKVTENDFLFSLAVPGVMNNTFHFSFTPGDANEFPGVNGLQLSMSRVDIAPYGVFPIHTHPGGNELLTVVSGTIFVTFISTANTVYSKTLRKWDVFVLPRGLPHFLINPGRVPAVGLASFSSSRPGIQFTDLVLFGNSLSSKLVEAATLIDQGQVKKLKRVFGGSG